MTYQQFQARWSDLSDEQRDIVRTRAAVEQMTLWNTLAEYWPIHDPEVLDEDED